MLLIALPLISSRFEITEQLVKLRLDTAVLLRHSGHLQMQTLICSIHVFDLLCVALAMVLHFSNPNALVSKPFSSLLLLPGYLGL